MFSCSVVQLFLCSFFSLVCVVVYVDDVEVVVHVPCHAPHDVVVVVVVVIGEG